VYPKPCLSLPHSPWLFSELPVRRHACLFSNVLLRYDSNDSFTDRRHSRLCTSLCSSLAHSGDHMPVYDLTGESPRRL
jgi:hypothetical protein